MPLIGHPDATYIASQIEDVEAPPGWAFLCVPVTERTARRLRTAQTRRGSELTERLRAQAEEMAD